MFKALVSAYALQRDVETIAGAFDHAHYVRQGPEFAKLDDRGRLVHYCTLGWHEKRDPSRDFSTARYLEAYPDIAAAGINPFAHYLSRGRQEGLSGRPAIASDVELDVLEEMFDPGYYRFCNPDLAGLGDRELVEHYHRKGWYEKRDPSPAFSVEAYLEAYPEVQRRGHDPLHHFLTEGRAAGYEAARPLPKRFEDLAEDEIDRLEEAFNAKFYRAISGQETTEARALLAHHVDTGWKIGFDPSPAFSNAYYRGAYGVRDGVCPFVDFVLGDYPVARRGAAHSPQVFDLDPEASIVPHQMFRVLKRPARPEPAPDPRTGGLELHWVIPDFPKGSGGHATIFRMIRFLEHFGHRNVIWIEQPIYHQNVRHAHDDIVKSGQCVAADVRFVSDAFFAATGDAVIATGWSSAYYAAAATGFGAAFYFVQDHEPDFFPASTERVLARRTYDFDLACIAAGPWLSALMRDTYGRWSRDFALAFDPGIYHPRARPETRHFTQEGKLNIALYAREHTARRCVHLAFMALELLALERDDFVVHLFGQDTMGARAAPFAMMNHGILAEAELARLYGECDLGICFSGTNYSLVGLEMMASALAVVELDSPGTRAVFPEDVVTFAGAAPETIRESIAALLDDPARGEKQRAAASAWVGQFSWEASARDVEAALTERLVETGARQAAPAIIPAQDIAMDVVIPTFNGMGEIEPVIEALRIQRGAETLQIHCIDSSSGDGTTEWLRAQQDVALTVIDAAEFQHGRTRNAAAGQGQAPLIAFLTQDAQPIGRNWARDMITMMTHHATAAGVFGRHEAYPHHPLRVRQDIAAHFRNMLKHPLALSRDTDPERWEQGDPGWRRLLHFYSDNNSAMRRDIWRAHPYPKVDFGEDQLWARQIIEAGHTKLYAPTAVVYHSHDFTPEEAYARARTEGAFFLTYFGYELGEGSREDLEARIESAQRDLAGWAVTHGVRAAELARQQEILARRYHGWRDGRLSAAP